MKNIFRWLGTQTGSDHLKDTEIMKKASESTEEKSKEKPASMFNRLRNMEAIGFSPKVIFDCGAHVGGWSQKVSKIFLEWH